MFYNYNIPKPGKRCFSTNYKWKWVLTLQKSKQSMGWTMKSIVIKDIDKINKAIESGLDG